MRVSTYYLGIRATSSGIFGIYDNNFAPLLDSRTIFWPTLPPL